MRKPGLDLVRSQVKSKNFVYILYDEISIKYQFYVFYKVLKIIR